VARDRTRFVKQRAQDRRMSPTVDVDHRNRLLDEGRVDGLRAHAEMLVDLGPPAHGPHRRIGVRQRKMSARRVEQIQVEVRGQILPEPHALIVEPDAFRREIVRADDRGVAAGIASADIAFLEHRDVADPVIAGEIIRRREAVAAGADDDHVVSGLELLGPREHSRLRMPSTETKTQEAMGHMRCGEPVSLVKAA